MQDAFGNPVGTAATTVTMAIGTNAGGATLGDKFRGKLDKLKPKEQQ